MCYQPVHIKNPVLEFDMIKDKYMLDVPCGHCEECKKRKRTDWFVRTYYHFKYVHEQCHGFCLYVTLTYDNAFLPHIKLHDGSLVPCFSSIDIQRFFKRLRINLSRHHNITDVSYFLSSEYGGTTHRPHYHFLLFVHCGCNPAIVRKEIRNAWTFGFISFGQNGGLVPSNENGAFRYVAKYVAKDVMTDDWFQHVTESVSDEDYYRLRSAKPFIRVSRYFGVHLTDYVSEDDIIAGQVKIPSAKGYDFVTLPRYYDYRLFYDRTLNKHGNVQFVLNSKGEYAFLFRYKKKVEFIKNKVSEFLSSSFLINQFNEVSNYAFDSISSLKERFKSLISNDLDNFVNYILNYRGYSCFAILNHFEYDGVIPDTNFVYTRRLLRERGSSYTYNDLVINLLTNFDSNLCEASKIFFDWQKMCSQLKQKSDVQKDIAYTKLRSLYG